MSPCSYCNVNCRNRNINTIALKYYVWPFTWNMAPFTHTYPVIYMPRFLYISVFITKFFYELKIKPSYCACIKEWWPRLMHFPAALFASCYSFQTTPESTSSHLCTYYPPAASAGQPVHIQQPHWWSFSVSDLPPSLSQIPQSPSRSSSFESLDESVVSGYHLWQRSTAPASDFSPSLPSLSAFICSFSASILQPVF